MTRDPREPGGGTVGEVLFEIHRVGETLRVAAIDARTGTEVVVFGPASAGEDALCRLARRKLTRALVAGR